MNNEEMTEAMQNKLLPLGSIVVLNGVIKKIMITQRAIQLTQDGDVTYYDYGAVPYPEGLIDDELAYFNRDQIMRVMHVGFSDDEDELMQEQIQAALANMDDEDDDDSSENDVTEGNDTGADPFADIPKE